MEQLNINQYLNKNDGDVLNASDWNGSLGAVLTKTNQLVTYANQDHSPKVKNNSNEFLGYLNSIRQGFCSLEPVAGEISKWYLKIPEEITATHMAYGAVGSNQLSDNAVVTNKVANGAITTNKIADYAVTAQKTETYVIDLDETSFLYEDDLDVVRTITGISNLDPGVFYDISDLSYERKGGIELEDYSFLNANLIDNVYIQMIAFGHEFSANIQYPNQSYDKAIKVQYYDTDTKELINIEFCVGWDGQGAVESMNAGVYKTYVPSNIPHFTELVDANGTNGFASTIPPTGIYLWGGIPAQVRSTLYGILPLYEVLLFRHPDAGSDMYLEYRKQNSTNYSQYACYDNTNPAPQDIVNAFIQ